MTKLQCRQQTHSLIRKGVIIKETCSACGEKKVQCHHNDYDNPMDVEWLCIKHHMEKHGKVFTGIKKSRKGKHVVSIPDVLVPQIQDFRKQYFPHLSLPQMLIHCTVEDIKRKEKPNG